MRRSPDAARRRQRVSELPVLGRVGAPPGRRWLRPGAPRVSVERRRKVRAAAAVALAALLLVLANAGKPLVVDDAAYTYYARQIAAAPADPYGFEIFWYGKPEPAFGVLAPPVLPYWLAASMVLFGDEPVRWKLALFPFALALAASLQSLLARFAAGLEAPLLWMALLSPAVLPFFNLMLDVPSLALALSALALFLGACD